MPKLLRRGFIKNIAGVIAALFTRTVFGQIVPFHYVKPSNLLGWGWNSNGQVGNGKGGGPSTEYRPVFISALANWAHADAGINYCLAVREDGSLWGWGLNYYGTIGDGTNGWTADKWSPVQVGSLKNWKKVSCGFEFSTALKTDGTLWSWGNNFPDGQLGIGTTAFKNSPVQIGGANNWAAIAAGGRHCLAIKTNGTLWSWGDNAVGQLGIGSTLDRSNPVQIGAMTNWAYVSCGNASSYALKTDGTVWAWGSNGGWGSYSGLLGNGAAADMSSPVQIGSLTNWAMVSSQWSHVLAIKTDGTLWSWGANNSGQLGNGTTTGTNSPVQIGGMTDWAYCAAAVNVSLAIKTDGTLWAWGSSIGLGVGGGPNRSSPVQVGNINKWLMVAGHQHNVGILKT